MQFLTESIEALNGRSVGHNSILEWIPIAMHQGDGKPETL
jgi:hypothetical protein